jgi:hypothetical protein
MIKKGEFYYIWDYSPKSSKQKITLNKVQVMEPPTYPGDVGVIVKQIKVFYPQWPFKEDKSLATDVTMLKTEKQLNQMSFRNKRLTITNTFLTDFDKKA